MFIIYFIYEIYLCFSDVESTDESKCEFDEDVDNEKEVANTDVTDDEYKIRIDLTVKHIVIDFF